MDSNILPYLEVAKRNVKRKISDVLSVERTSEVARAAFDFHFEDKGSLAFQEYYRATVSNRNEFLSGRDFFRVFKHKYALQGIDGQHLARLEREKATLIQLVEEDNLARLYFEFFADVSLRHGQGVTQKTLGSFFAKFVHTFRPDKYCALDNPIKTYFGLRRESFYVAFVLISQAYGEWASENPRLMEQIRAELARNKRGQSYSSSLTDLKLLDLIFWHRANRGRERGTLAFS